MSKTYKLTLPPQSMESAEPQAKAVLDKALASVGFIPNMYAGMVNSPGLLDTYLHGYALFRNESGFSPQEQEVVFLTISHENQCTYCVAAHSALADMKMGVPIDVTDAIRDSKQIPDNKLAALSQFTRVMVQSRGNPNDAEMAAFLQAGYSERHALEVVLAISVKTISNYSNHLLHTEVDEMFAGRVWEG